MVVASRLPRLCARGESQAGGSANDWKMSLYAGQALRCPTCSDVGVMMRDCADGKAQSVLYDQRKIDGRFVYERCEEIEKRTRNGRRLIKERMFLDDSTGR